MNVSRSANIVSRSSPIVWRCDNCGQEGAGYDDFMASDCWKGRYPYYAKDEPDHVVVMEKRFEHWVGKLTVYRTERYQRDERYELAKKLAKEPHADVACRLGALQGGAWLYYSHGGDYIGDEMRVRHLELRGIVPETIPGKKVCSIGFSATSQTWWGWSHRALWGFAIGYVAEEGHFTTTPGVIPEALAEDPSLDKSVPVGFVCNTLDDCKRCAIAFANAVS